MKKKTWWPVGTMAVIIFGWLAVIYLGSPDEEKRYIGSLPVPCNRDIEVKFFQSQEEFEQYQGLMFYFEDKHGSSVWTTLGGTDDFGGVELKEFEVLCKDSIVIVRLRSGSLESSFTIQEVSAMLEENNK